MNKFPKIPRVVVTGETDGKSTIIQDGKSNNISEHVTNLVISDIWATNTMPVNLHKAVEIENTLFPITPKNGSYVRYVSVPPDSEILGMVQITLILVNKIRAETTMGMVKC